MKTHLPSFGRLALSICLLGMIAGPAFSQTAIDSLDADYLNWYNKDLKKDKILGASVDKAYADLLADRKPQKKVIVAVIDAGVDVNHEDLKGKIWTNEGEIAGNGKDDDGNGYIDDIHGWNFLGSVTGQNLEYENYEFVRIMRTYKPYFDKIESEEDIPDNFKERYEVYKKCQERYAEEYKRIKEEATQVQAFNQVFNQSHVVVQEFLDTDKKIQPEDLDKIRTDDRSVLQAVSFLNFLFSEGFTHRELREMNEHVGTALNKHLNIDYDGRSIIGDNINDITDVQGNKDVIGEGATHGTLVAGIIAANRNNGIGIDGIADNVEIMTLRTVPDGDEYDKDVALSIRYAVDNGADILNLSFGKDFSPQKELVDEALAYAASKNVLIIHAAGNSALDIDEIIHYPIEYFNSGDSISNWLVIGANDMKKGKKMVGVFSNYGKKSVDLFAPGVNIVSLVPGSKYDMADGTSFSAPVVSGVAALVWSHYPTLTASELRDVLVESVTDLSKKKVLKPDVEGGDSEKLKFGELSQTGGVVNAYKALELAAKITKDRT